MKNKASLMLIEQLIMLAVFTVTAAVCLKVFSYSNSLSEKIDRKSDACILAQSTAETIKNTQGEILTGGAYTAREGELTVAATEEQSGSSFLGAAKVSVFYGEEELFSIPVMWQKTPEGSTP